MEAKKLLRGKQKEADTAPQPSERDKWYSFAWLLPHVCLTHAITFMIGSLLFLLGRFDNLKVLLGVVKGAG
jgi:hypothetical protein